MQEIQRSLIPTVKGEVAANAVTSNFLVYLNDPSRRDWALKRAEDLAKRLSARIIILDASRRPNTSGLIPPPLHAPRYEVAVSGLAVETIVSLVNATLSPSMPTALWWCARDDVKDTLLLSLAELVEHLVLDSTQIKQATGIIADLALIYARIPKLILRDLAWVRTAPWRDAIAHLFESRQATLEPLRIIRVEIASSSVAESMYLIGWLASRLGWSVAGHHRFIDREGAIVNILFTENDAHESPIHSVRLRTASAELSVQITESPVALLCRSSLNAKHMVERIQPYLPIDPSYLIERALLREGKDELFEAALRIVRDFGSLRE